jgi:uncharacterized membrane protein YgdD (TMEM256/DUF423 family)
MLSPKTSLILGALLGFLSVALGAFGAHALKDALIQQGRLATYETAVQYQMYHALALVLVGILGWVRPDMSLGGVSTAFLLGIVIFSGSLFLLCATGLKWMGAITPLGGLAFRSGWLMLAYRVWKLT